MAPRLQPWSPADATQELRIIGSNHNLSIHYKKHAKERLAERGLIVGDVLYVLKYGFVHSLPESATQDGYYKYRMECKTPNSGAREVRIVVIPDAQSCEVKIVTVMWVDE